jgi:osmotically inducible protein OsmC
MALSNELGKNGTPPTRLDVDVVVTFVPGTGITTSAISVVGEVPGMTADKFEAFAATAKDGCPVSQALKGVEISLRSATLL